MAEDQMAGASRFGPCARTIEDTRAVPGGAVPRETSVGEALTYLGATAARGDRGRDELPASRAS